MTVNNNQTSVPIEAMGYIARDTDTLNKTIKTIIPALSISVAIMDFIPAAAGAQTGLKLLGDQLSTAKSVISATNVLERGYEWGTEKTRTALFKRWQKVANRVALTAAQILETVLFVDKCTTRFFSQAALKVCNVPIFEAAKGGLYIISAVFGLWTAGQDMSKAISSNKNAEEKKHKWEEMEVDTLKAKYEDKYLDVNPMQLNTKVHEKEKQIESFQGQLQNADAKDVKGIRTELKKAQGELTGLKVDQVAAEKIAIYNQAIKDGKVEDLRKHKIKKYETRIANNGKIQEKSWISIAVDIGKIVMISLGLGVVALSVKYPELKGPAATLVLSSLGLLASSLGLTKNIYSEFGPKTVPEPTFKLATA